MLGLTSAARGGGTQITGCGATDAAWNHSHVADHVYAPGAAYDPDPALPKANGRTADHYVAYSTSTGTCGVTVSRVEHLFLGQDELIRLIEDTPGRCLA